MSVDVSRLRILQFLDQQLFRPILGDDPDQYPAFRRDEVKAVRGIILRDYEHIRSEPSANAMILEFREAARRSAETGLDARLSGLNLPTFGGVREELEKLAAELGVPGRPEPISSPS